MILILLSITAVLGVICIVLAVLYLLVPLSYRKSLANVRDQRDVAQAEVERLLEEVARLQKSADHATIPLAEDAKPEPPKRTRKKAGTS